MKKYIIAALIFVSACPAFSQQWSVGGRIGFGSYSMDGLKQLQESRAKQTTLPLSATDEFPVTLNYRFELALNNLSFIDKIGVFYAFNSTGARNTMSDYSGYVNIDAIINGNLTGLTVQKNVYGNGALSGGFYADGSYLFSKLKTKDRLEIASPSQLLQEEKMEFNSEGFCAEPGVYLKYRVSFVELQFNMGYFLDFSGKLYVDGTKDQWLAVNRSVIKPQWNGIRLGLQASAYFQKRQGSATGFNLQSLL